MRKGIVDRFEGEYAVVEFNGNVEDILKLELPAELKTGDMLIFEEDGKVTLNKKESADRKKEINDLMDELFED